MRILGIDYGTKRVGVAVSDEARKFALPVSVIQNTDLLVTEIKKIAEQHETKEIVMGESRNFKQEPNIILEDSLKLKRKLEKEGFIVHFEPEFMTSVQAERFQGKNVMHDASAAAIILQSYLDRSMRENIQ